MNTRLTGLPAWRNLNLSALGPAVNAVARKPQWWLRALNLALCAILGLQLAWLVWMLVPVKVNNTTPPPGIAGSSATATRIDIDSIVNMPLFGVLVSTAAPQNAPSNAPETHLNLTLTGIMAASDPQAARALIQDDKGEQHSYAIGDDVPGGAKISAIHPDRVILLRNGRYETLSLQADLLPTQASTDSSSIAPPGGLSADTVAQLREARQEILGNPAKASDYFRIQPVYKSGKLQGYRIYPGRKRQLFTKIGLTPGELLTSVNGTQLNDPVASLGILGQLAQASSLTLTLERNGHSRTVNINLQ